MDKFIITGYIGEAAENMFYDLKYFKSRKYDVLITPNVFVPFNLSIIKLLNKIHFSPRLNKYFNLPFKKLWNKYYYLNNIKIDNSKKNYIVFVNSIFTRYYDRNLLIDLKNKGYTLIIYIVDSYESSSCRRLKELKLIQLFDLVYSIDKRDCTKYGFIYSELIMSRVPIKEVGTNINNDIYFIGGNGGRYEFLCKIAQKMKEHSVKYYFCMNNIENNKYGVIPLKKWISYNDNTKMIAQTNCLLEILHDGFATETQRTMEAFIYNKKLLTNNGNIVNSPFYNSDYVKIFHKIDEIDWDFIKDKAVVNYKYDGRYSPIVFLDIIKSDLSAKKWTQENKG